MRMHPLWFPMLAAAALSSCAQKDVSPLPSAAQFQRVKSLSVQHLPNVTVYTLGDGGSNAAFPAELRVGSDGKLYYSTVAASATAGEIGSFDFSTHAQSYSGVPYLPSFLIETAHGIWVEQSGHAANVMNYYAAIGGADTAINIPIKGSVVGIYGGIALGADGQVWWGAGHEPYVGEIDQTTHAVSIYRLAAKPKPIPATPDWIALGTDRHIWVTDGAQGLMGVYRVTSTGSSKGKSAFLQTPQICCSMAGVAAGSDGNIYVANSMTTTNFDSSGAIYRGSQSNTPNFVSLPMPSISIQPGALEAAPGKIYFEEGKFGGLGIYDIASGSMVILPLAPAASGLDIAVDSTGTPWIGCSNAGVACVESVSLASTWQVFPSQNIQLYTQDPNGKALPPGLIGIGETGNSGPFTVRSSNNAICTAAVLKGFDHNVGVKPVAAGSCTLTITDAHKVSVQVAVTVNNGSGSPQAKAPPP